MRRHDVITASARPLGAELFNRFGASLVPAWIAFGIQIVSVVLVLAMDGSKFQKNVNEIQEKVAEKSAEKKHSKRRSFLGLSMVALPLALLNGAQYIMYNMDANFMPDFAQLARPRLPRPATLGGTIFGVLSIVVGFVCDFMNPAVLIVVSFAGSRRALPAGHGHEQGAFSTAIMIYFITAYYTMPLKIMAMKRAPASEQGAVSGTILFGQDLFSIVATTALRRNDRQHRLLEHLLFPRRPRRRPAGHLHHIRRA